MGRAKRLKGWLKGGNILHPQPTHSRYGDGAYALPQDLRAKDFGLRIRGLISIRHNNEVSEVGMAAPYESFPMAVAARGTAALQTSRQRQPVASKWRPAAPQQHLKRQRSRAAWQQQCNAAATQASASGCTASRRLR
ncbi:hypothetical protein NDU88_001234 [Pleurodeles waltl]|uniref:Uncharacterized protein n=1 Tax=Pleurodeles waltl TaxID=8319 RepID=A0AAV7NCV8_PLEWA|nr:hypothetical protein NDU88_001234 [Pleurodeles waltl]